MKKYIHKTTGETIFAEQAAADVVHGAITAPKGSWRVYRHPDRKVEHLAYSDTHFKEHFKEVTEPVAAANIPPSKSVA